MRKIIKPFRIILIVALPLLLACATLLALYNLQILRSAEYYEESINTVMSTETVPAARGRLLDRYGRVLVTNRLSYDVRIDRSRLVEAEDPNGILLSLIDLVTEAGVPYTDTLPLSSAAPFSYTEMTDSQRSRLSQYLEHFELGAELDAPGLMDWFQAHYKIPETMSPEQARLAAGVRYELELRALFHISDYVFASDLDAELVAAVSERVYPGVGIHTSAARSYATDYASHILGHTGRMDEKELAYYTELGYPMDAVIGKAGMEAAFEEYLHGSDGERVTIRTAGGEIVGSYYTVEPRAGSDVTTTLDLACQQAAEEALAREIEKINANRLADAEPGEEVQLAESGAVVVIQVGTGDILAMASYPSYRLETFSRDYSQLLNDPAAPLYNRATQGRYAPGSTFKIVTATAGLSTGVLSADTKIYDRSIVDEYEGYSYTCWAYPGSHGSIDVREALQVSCNYFFYMVGRDVGIDSLSQYAADFGLGQSTGIELYENTGVLASRAYKEETVGESWYVGDTFQAAIGQSYNLFTPLQLASYAATVASDGIRYATRLLRSVSSGSGTDIRSSEPKVLSRVDADADDFALIKEGLVMASRYGSPSYVFGNYDVDVCSKTGTAQVSEDSVNNAVFISFAPQDEPEIAISVVVENGGSGYYLAEVARDIFDWYFARQEEPLLPPENQLIP